MAQKTERAVIQVIINGDVANKSLKDLQAASRSLEAQIRKTNDAAARSKMAEQYRNINKEVSKVRAEMKGVETGWQSFMKSTKSIAAGVVGGNLITAGIQQLFMFIPNLIQKNAELADSFANVRKTTGMTAEEVEKLNNGLKKIDTRTSRKELLSLATEAGKLGYSSVEDVKKFVEQADKINVALGEDLGQGAVTEIGKLSNIFGTEMLNIASAINEVGAASEASEAYQVDFLKRMSGTAPTVKLAADEVLGYGAALESLGQAQEVSATALNTFFIDFVSKADQFGKVAGYARGELKKLIEEKGTNAAFLEFLEKLKTGSASSEEMINKLKDLGIDGARGSNVLLTLANNIEKVRVQQGIANQAIQDGSSITREFEIRNNNLAGAWEKLGKKMNALYTNSSLKNFFEVLIVSLADTRTEAQKLADEFQSQTTRLDNLDKKLPALIKTYDDLKGKGKLTKEEQNKLNETIQKIAELVPSAITGVDKYGKALDINITSVNKFAEAQRALSRVLNKKAIEEYNAEIVNTQEQINIAQRMANDSIKRYNEFINSGKNDERVNKNFESAIERQQNKIDELRKSLSDLVIARASLQGEDATKYIAGAGVKTQVDSDKGTKTTGGNSMSEDEQKKYIESTKQLLDELKNIQAAAIEDEMQRELAAALAKKDNRQRQISEEVADKKVKNELLKALDEKYHTEVIDITEKYGKERTEKEYESSILSTKDFYAKKQALMLNDLENGIITKEEYDTKSLENERQLRDALLTVANDYSNVLTNAEKDAIELRLKNIEAGYNKEQLLREQNNRRALAIAENNLNKTKAGTRERLDAEIELLNQRMIVEISNVTLTEEEKLAIRTRFNIDTEAMQKEFNLRTAQDIVSMYMSISTAVTEIMNQQADYELQLLRSKYEIESELREESYEEQKSGLESIYAIERQQLDEQFKMRLISKSNYDNRIKELEKRKNRELLQAEDNYNLARERSEAEYQDKVRQIKREQFVRDKTARTIEATINGALAVVSMLKYGPIAAAATGIAAAAQIATIISQPVPLFKKGGIIQGPSHENGGISLIANGNKIGEMEGGEPHMILSKNTYKNNKPIIDALLDSSMNKNGAPIMPDFNGIRNAASGLGQSSTSSNKVQSNLTGANELLYAAKLLLNAASKFGSSIEKFDVITDKDITAVVDYNSLADSIKDNRRIKKNASSGASSNDGKIIGDKIFLNEEFL